MCVVFSFDVEIKVKSGKVADMTTGTCSAGVSNSHFDVCSHFQAGLGRITDVGLSSQKSFFSEPSH